MQVQPYTRMSDHAAAEPPPPAVGGWIFLWLTVFAAAIVGLIYVHYRTDWHGFDALVVITRSDVLWACAAAAAGSLLAFVTVIIAHLRAVGEHNLRLAWHAEATVDRLLEEIRVACTDGEDGEQPLAKWQVENDAHIAEVGHLSRAVAPIPDAIGDIKQTAAQAADHARNAAAAATVGATAVQTTIAGITDNNARIGEAATRLRKIAADMQQFNDTVGMVGEVTEQVSILSLNASLRGGGPGAVASGEAGEVAEEMRRLADRATRGAHDIRALVAAMQADAATVAGELESVSAVDCVAAEQAAQALADIQVASRALLIAMKQTANGAADEAVQVRRVAERIAQLRIAVEHAGANAARIAERIEQLKVASGIGRTLPDGTPAQASPSSPESSPSSEPSPSSSPSSEPSPSSSPSSAPSQPEPSPAPSPSKPSPEPSHPFPPPPTPKPRKPSLPFPPSS